MKQYYKILLKKSLFILLSNTKEEQIQILNKRQSNKGFAGRLFYVGLNPHSTRFEVSEFVKQSKKLRSNIIQILEKDILQYNIIGICIRETADEFTLNKQFLLRNVIDKIAFEYYCPIHSPFIDYVGILYIRHKLKYLNHAKYYYLRIKPLPLSETIFDYVTNIYENDINEEDEHNNNEEDEHNNNKEQDEHV